MQALKQGLEGWFRADSERQARCGCGEVFTQQQLSERFMQMAERHSQEAVDAVMREMPDLYTPPRCPKCERKKLYPPPVIPYVPVELRPRLRNEVRFAENMARLFGAYNRPHDDATVRAYWKALEFQMSDDEFEQRVIDVIRVERKWPTAAAIAQLTRAAA